MKEQVINNPFVVGRYVSDRYFCDRNEETEFLHKQIINGRNVALISPRRMGKSGLIEHYFAQPYIKDKYHAIFVDIYATTSFTEFIYALGKAVYEQMKSRQTVWGERFFQIVRSLRIGFKLDIHTGNPSFDISLGDIKTPNTTLDEIFEYLESASLPCILAIDEFQQIGNYTEKNIEALLRTKIQHCKQTHFIFSGSKRHLMSNMFNSPTKPFYQSSIIMGLEAIRLPIYTNFAVKMFNEYNRNVETEVIETVYNKYDGCTWFVQMMMNELFAMTTENKTCTTEMIDQACENVVERQYMGYMEQLANLPPKQKQLLQAIAKERNVTGITSSAFIKKYNLASASSVQAALKPLLAADIVTSTDNTYRIYDYFFAEWLAKVM